MDRQRFIDARLFWAARINRADLIAAFAVSAAQAAIDFREYLKLARGVTYDTSAKAYVATAGFAPAFGPPDARTALVEFSDRDDPWTTMLPQLQRPLDPGIAARVRRAARDRERLHVDYQSFTQPKALRRWIAPARLVSDGERWHARCWCFQHDEWRDFVLARIIDIRGSQSAGDLPPDADWLELVEIVIEPAPHLSAGQKASVTREFAMKNGRLKIKLPRAMRIYAIRQWGLDRPDSRLVLVKGAIR